MKDLVPVTFDRILGRQELATLQQLLATGQPLEETRDLKPLFESCRFLTLCLGLFGWGLAEPDLVAFQYQLFGDFACDIVVGDSKRHQYAFIELEDASPSSIFRRQGAKAVLEWAPRFERAFSQVVDWFWKLDDMASTAEFETRFGRRQARYYGLIVIGRSADLAHGRDRQRWEWRRHKLLVNSLPVYCVTYDELCEDLTTRLDGHYLQAGQ